MGTYIRRFILCTVPRLSENHKNHGLQLTASCKDQRIIYAHRKLLHIGPLEVVTLHTDWQQLSRV